MVLNANGNHLSLRDQLKILKDKIQVRVTKKARPKPSGASAKPRPVVSAPEVQAKPRGKTVRLPKKNEEAT